MINKKVVTAVKVLAEQNSFTVAADVMGTSPASVSRYIRQAEDYAGHTIFERKGNGASLTSAGKEFLKVLDAFHNASNLFETNVNRLRSDGPRHLNIGCGPLATRTIIAPLLTECLQQKKDLSARVKVRATQEPLEDLRAGVLDVVVCDLTHTPDLRDLDIQLVRKEQVTFWARPSHPLHKDKAKVSVGDIFRSPFVTAYLHKHWRTAIARILGNDREAWQIVDALPQIESDDFAFLSELTCHSDLICAGMRQDFEQHCALGLLKELQTHETMTWNICAAKRSGNTFPALEMFWGRLAATYGLQQEEVLA